MTRVHGTAERSRIRREVKHLLTSQFCSAYRKEGSAYYGESRRTPDGKIFELDLSHSPIPHVFPLNYSFC